MTNRIHTSRSKEAATVSNAELCRLRYASPGNKPSGFATIQRFSPRVLYREWGEEIIVAETQQYLGKLLRMRAGTRGGLQYHVNKTETFYLLTGKALVECETLRSTSGELALTTVAMSSGESYHIPPGAVHRVHAVTNCVFVEASTPHYDDRVHVEGIYGLPETGGLPTSTP